MPGTEQIEAAAGAFADPVLVEALFSEDEVLREVRRRAAAADVAVPSPATGSTLRFLATMLDARSVVEVGTVSGVAGLWLLRGMRAGGVLTSVDPDPEGGRLAKAAFSDAGVAPNRTRLIAGRPLEVLPRLTDAHYDLMVAWGDPHDYATYLGEARRLLREGGVVVFGDPGPEGVSGPGAAQTRRLAIGDLSEALLAAEDFAALPMPVGSGLLIAVKRAPAP